MKITAVTTFHAEGMLTYGQRLIDSWQQRVDPKIKLIVYAEDCEPETNGTNVEVLDAKFILTKLNGSKERWGNVPKQTVNVLGQKNVLEIIIKSLNGTQ